MAEGASKFAQCSSLCQLTCFTLFALCKGTLTCSPTHFRWLFDIFFQHYSSLLAVFKDTYHIASSRLSSNYVPELSLCVLLLTFAVHILPCYHNFLYSMNCFL